jgi:hypothetical protein
MKKIITIALVTMAIAATALIAVPALAKDVPAQAQTAVQTVPVAVQPSLTAATNSLYMGYGTAFCGGGLALHDEDTLQLVANTLGITYDQLILRLGNGETIADIAVAQKVDLSKVVDVIVAAQTKLVNALVENGYITADEAATIIANLRIRVETALSLTGYAGGCGCYRFSDPEVTPVAPYGCIVDGTNVTPGTGYGYGMMGGRVAHGCYNW